MADIYVQSCNSLQHFSPMSLFIITLGLSTCEFWSMLTLANVVFQTCGLTRYSRYSLLTLSDRLPLAVHERYQFFLFNKIVSIKVCCQSSLL